LAKAVVSKDEGLTELKPDPSPPAELTVWQKLEIAFNTRTEPLTHVDCVDGDGKVVHSPFPVQNALWKQEIFGVAREPAPETEQKREALRKTLKRVVIGIDTSGGAGESHKRSNEVGIVVAGVAHDGTGRILEDATGRYSLHEWVDMALALSDLWEGDRIVTYGNSGGAFVESAIHTARRMASVQLVSASSAKAQRAEPVAKLYERGKVRHVGQFAELERQYCQFETNGYKGAESPNRANAAIWALTDLMLDP
jgi:phage terminase large subunit-like protein